MDKLENLKKLKKLLDDGVLSEKEYSEMKNEIIGNTSNSQVNPIEVEKYGLAKDSTESKSENIFEQIASNSTLIDGIYLTEDNNLVKSLKFLDDVSGYSGWSGLAESIGIKKLRFSARHLIE